MYLDMGFETLTLFSCANFNYAMRIGRNVRSYNVERRRRLPISGSLEPLQPVRMLRICKLRISESKFVGNSLRTYEFPPLGIKNLLGSHPLKSRFLVRGLTATETTRGTPTPTSNTHGSFLNLNA